MGFRARVGDLNDAFARRGDDVDFLFVYGREAYPESHPTPAPIPNGPPVRVATTNEERCSTADRCVESLGIDLPTAVDPVSNEVVLAYDAYPFRLFVLAPDGRVVVRGAKGASGFGPALEAAEAWLDGAAVSSKYDRLGRTYDATLRAGPIDPKGRAGRLELELAPVQIDSKKPDASAALSDAPRLMWSTPELVIRSYGSEEPQRIQLPDFKPVEVRKGESQTLSFELDDRWFEKKTRYHVAIQVNDGKGSTFQSLPLTLDRRERPDKE